MNYQAKIKIILYKTIFQVDVSVSYYEIMPFLKKKAMSIKFL